jgi:hypothetical protein
LEAEIAEAEDELEELEEKLADGARVLRAPHALAVDQKISLSKKTEMFQLNDLRSNVQHWGVSPFSRARYRNLKLPEQTQNHHHDYGDT